MRKAKDGRDIELITLISNKEEFISKLPWESEEISSIHVAELAKKELKGKTDQKIGGGNSGCIKRLMTALEKEFSGRLFRIRLSGSDRFWSLTNPELLKKFRIQFGKIEETAIIVPQEPEVVIPSTVHVETPIESSTSEHKEIEVKKKKDKPVPAPEKGDMLKAYLLLELLMCGKPYPSSKIKEISKHMGWKIPIYEDVNRVLKYYELKNFVDTSGKRIIKLTPEIKRGDEDIHLLISMLESEVSPIPEDIVYFIEMGEIRKIEEKETIPSTTEEDEPSLESKEKVEEQKEEKMKEVLDMDKPSQLDFLKKFLYNSGKYIVFQSELFQKIRLLHLDKITKPCEDFRDDPDVRIEPSRFNKDLGVREVRYVLTDSYCKRMKHDDTTEEEQISQPEETVEVVIQESDHQPESKAETKPTMIELYSMKELNTGMKFSYSKQILLSIWKYGIQIETKEDALRLIKLYYSHLGEVEFEDGATTLAALDNIVLS